MADHNKGGFISKATKKLTRTKTKVLQNLGKAEKTSDERFDEHVHKLERQQEVAHRFQKELRNYIHCAKAMEIASKSFYGVMLETYEQDWKDEAKLRETLQSLELMWADYLQHLQESVQDPLSTYSSHFPLLKQRISKRNRKLDYFDNARHNAEVQHNAKKRDEVKITKANEELEESKRIYEVLNNELHNELPEFYNSRINFFATTYKNFFNAESTFHGESGKLNDTAMSIADTLADEHKQYTYQPRPISGLMTNEESVVNGNSSGDNDSNHSNPTPSKKDKTSPKPNRPPSSPGSTGSARGIPTPIKTSNEKLTNGMPSDPESPPESPQTEAQPKVGQTEADQNEVTQSESCYSEITRSEVAQTESTQSEVKTQVEKKGPLYENSELSYTQPIKKERTPENESSKNLASPVKKSEEPVVKSAHGSDDDDEEPARERDPIPSYPPPQPPKEPPPTDEDDDDIPSKPTPPLGRKEVVEEDDLDHYYDKVPDQLAKVDLNEDDNLYEVPSSSKIPDVLPDGCLYVVLATHLYRNEDEDELSFEAGDLIYVVPFDDPDDQDDGWLMGIKKSDGKKGVFPENFTKRV